MADARLVKAISRIATQYIPNTSGDVQLGWVARINDYSGRLLAAAFPAAATDDDEAAPAEAWSSDRNVAIHQILAETGHPTIVENGVTIGASDPAEVRADANPAQLEALTVLGYFGATGAVPGVDYEPYERYYEKTSDDGQETVGWGPQGRLPDR